MGLGDNSIIMHIIRGIHFVESQNGWSTKHTKEVYNSLNEGLNSMTMDSLSKKNLVNCVIEKLKTKYPNGLSEVNDDSLKNTTEKLIASCGVESKVILGWTPMVDSIFRAKIMGSALIKGLPEQYKNPFCDCFVDRTKQLYPNGIPDSFSDSAKDSIKSFCSKKVIK